MEDFFFVDAHLHANSRSPEDFRRLAVAGCREVVVVAGPEAGFSGAASLEDYFRRLRRVDLPRIEACGIACRLALGLHPRALRGRPSLRALARLGKLLEKYQAQALGEVGLEEGSPLEKEVLVEQLRLAKERNLPVIVHTSRSGKARLLELSLEALERSALPPQRVLLDHLDEATLPRALSSGCWLGLTVHPTKLSPQQAAGLVGRLGSGKVILSSDLGETSGWLFAIPAAASAMEEAGVAAQDIRRVCHDNARDFFAS